MKCPKCGKSWGTKIGKFYHCYECGEVTTLPMTNEEWLQSATMEELAEWFGDWHSFSCVFCKHWKNGCIYNHNQVRCAIEEGKSNKELWMEWLKQPHQMTTK